MPEKPPLVSVIIPTFNRGRVICEAIDSVLDQDYPNFELIVVDDGSTDNTQSLLKKYKNRITVTNQKNKGVSAARNTGILQARGEYIALLDSDDLWKKRKLSSQIQFFLENNKAVICQTEEIWVRNGKRVNPKKKHKKPSGNIFEQSLHLCLVSPSAVMIKKSLFDVVGLFDEDLPACEDYDLWLRISIQFPIYLTENPYVIKKGGHHDQLSSAPGLDKYRIRSLEKILLNELLSEEQRTKVVKVLKDKCKIYANGCKKRERSDEAEHYLKIYGKY